MQQRRIQNGGVLALHQTQAPKALRTGDVRIRNRLFQARRHDLFRFSIHRRKGRCDGKILQPLRFGICDGLVDLILVQVRDGPAIIEITAMQRIGVPPDRISNIVRPVDHWRQAPTRRQAEAKDAGLGQLPTLDDGIGELRGADHHGLDLRTGQAAILQHGIERIGDAFHDIRTGQNLGRGDDRIAVHDHCIRMRAADIDSDLHGLALC